MNPRTRSPLGLVLLLNLLQEPAHAYRLHKLLQQTGKGRIVNIKSRASVYQAIERLQREGLIEPTQTSSVAGYPDRVEYAITDKGRAVAVEWLRELLGSSGSESPGFAIALSTVFVLTPDEARGRLQARRDQLISQLDETERAISGPDVPAHLPRLFLLDEYYRRAMLTAELTFTDQLISDLADGSLSWSREWLEEIATRFIQHE
jgi:DNA-binding PadR family transcriptional regulator